MKFSGVIKKGSARGKALGFPTANLDAPADLADGLYLGLANNQPALVFIGASITFGETIRRAEIYVLDFDGDLYDQVFEVEILKKIRESKKFDSPEELVAQMQKDESVARQFFAGYNKDN